MENNSAGRARDPRAGVGSAEAGRSRVRGEGGLRVFGIRGAGALAGRPWNVLPAHPRRTYPWSGAAFSGLPSTGAAGESCHGPWRGHKEAWRLPAHLTVRQTSDKPRPDSLQDTGHPPLSGPWNAKKTEGQGRVGSG